MKSVLITGGTGYFGHAFVERILSSTKCNRICIYSRSESAQASMRDKFHDDRLRFFIGDVRDRDRLKRAMQDIDIVVHAAALKRIEVGRYNPVEMVRTNVDGTINVIEAAQDAGVNGVVYLSTDKAYQPVSAYGHSKAMAESLIIGANNTVTARGPVFVTTRYGNVFNSTGSVVPRWKAMITAGATEIPVTDPECTRFFMRPGEAVDLVMAAIVQTTIGKAGVPYKSLLVPDLPAYRVGDLATAMGIGVGEGVDMVVTGLPDYEKLHEGMCAGNISDTAKRMSVSDLNYELYVIKDDAQ